MAPVEKKVVEEILDALEFYVKKDKRLWIERKPADDDPLVIRVKKHEALIDGVRELLKESDPEPEVEVEPEE